MNIKLNEDIDKKIIDCLDNKVKDISAPENMFFKIRTEILKEKKGALNNMKHKFLKPRIAVIAGLLCIAATITCVATTTTDSFSWMSRSSSGNITNTFPATDKVKSTIGYLPKYVEKFQGGFMFNGFNASNSALKNDQGKTVLNVKDADFYYKKDGATKDQILSLNAKSINKNYFDNEINTNKNKYTNGNIIEYKGIKIYYETIHRKDVPADYVKTKEDERLINEGTVEISYGSDSVNEYKSQGVIWYEGGIEYCIINCAYDDVSKTAMIEMAKTVINK